jgi:effector-binding domain-containing protein
VVDIEVVEREPQTAAAVHGEVPIGDLPGFFGDAFAKVLAAIAAAGVQVVGPPFGYYPVMPGEVVVVEAGFPTSVPVAADGDVHGLELPGGPAAVAVHVGPYETVDQTYGEMMAWMADRGHRPAVGMWESYLSDPEAEPDPSTWRTEIVCPIDDT